MIRPPYAIPERKYHTFCDQQGRVYSTSYLERHVNVFCCLATPVRELRLLACLIVPCGGQLMHCNHRCPWCLQPSPKLIDSSSLEDAPALLSNNVVSSCHPPHQWTLFQWGSKVSTNWSNTWKHACYCAFMYTFTEKHVCFHVMCT